MSKIAINNFVKRQSPDSEFSHYEGDWSDLIKLVEQHFNNAKPGYRDGVVLVPVPPADFASGVVCLQECDADIEDEMTAHYKARREGEAPFLSVTVDSEFKQPATHVEIACYRHDVLEADGDASTDAEWEIVSINAALSENEPMHPMTMARNQLDMEGGTKAEYSADDFAKAIIFWSQHAMAGSAS